MRRLLPLLLVFATGCAATTLLTKRRSWPDEEGDFSVFGLRQPVVIRRDEWGVPHVRAETTEDVFFTEGYLHSQDRLFEADVSRRMAFGHLAEWFGEEAVPYDLFARSLGIAERAQASYDALPADEQRYLQAYADGVNEAVRIQRVLPVEYRLLHLDFEPWTPVDCLAVIYAMSLELAENPAIELAALSLKDEVDAETIDALYRFDPKTPPVDAFWEDLRKVEIGPLLPGFEDYARRVGTHPDSAEASNSWIVGPAHSVDGFPVVANDPHLAQRIPSIWYTAELSGGDLHVGGATLPGVPGVVIGHNPHIAWGLTNTMADYVDLAVLERIDERHYRLRGEEMTFERVPIEIEVRGGGFVHAEVLRTEVGPVITDPKAPYVVALQWHALAVKDRTLSAFLDLNRAETVEQALAAMRVPMIVSQNLVVADVDKDWAWQIVGSIPMRRAHTGRVPYPASEPDQGWAGWLDDLPGERKPSRGFVVTANTRPNHPDAWKISTSYVPSHRRDRISAELQLKRRYTLKDIRIIQMDIHDQAAEMLLDDLISGVRPKSVPSRTCLTLLQEWDKEAQTTSVGATIWAVYQRELLRRILEDQLSERAIEVVLSTQSASRSVFFGDWEHFLGDRQRDVDAALHRTCTAITETYGPNPAAWTWGNVHRLELHHPFGDRLHAWNTPKVRYPGSGSTVAAAGYGWHDDLGVTSISSLRAVMPLSNLAVSTLSHAGGQSGHPGHPNYMQEFNRYARGGTLPLWFADIDVGTASRKVLILEPAAPE